MKHESPSEHTPLPRRKSAVLATRGAHLKRVLEGVWMAYQPIVDGWGGRTLGYEALLRTRDARLPNPSVLLDEAERLGRIHDVGRRTRALVADTAPHLSDETLLFVNIHPSDLTDGELYDERAPLSRFASRVVLELTERQSLHDIADLDGRLTELRRLGYRLAVDDLGSGYSGLSSICEVRPEVVKIDMSLVRDIDRSQAKSSLVRFLVAACSREMGVTVVAEGVETEAERERLVSFGCTWLQGYLYGRPEPLVFDR